MVNGDDGHDPCNVQLVFVEYSREAAFVLWDEEVEFLLAVPTTEVTLEVVDDDHPSTNEVETLRQTLAGVITEWDVLQAQLQEVTQALEQKRARVKEFWRMSCGLIKEYDAMVAANDNEIAALKAQLAEQKWWSTPSSTLSDVERDNKLGQ